MANINYYIIYIIIIYIKFVWIDYISYDDNNKILLYICQNIANSKKQL